ncbi:MAG: MFS transporter [Anaerolineae bacterium]|jgi:FSR family fosmidomycin resistance protein-like MFS transporter
MPEVAAALPAESEQFETDRVLTISAGHAVHDTYTGFLPPLLPAFIEAFSLTKTEAGLLSVFNQIPSLLQPFIGHLADRLSMRYFVILAPGVTATAMSLLGIAPSYAVLALLLMVSGLSSAALHSVAPVMAGRLSGKSLGLGMGFWMLGGEMGRFLGPLVVALYFRWEPDSLARLPLLMIGGWLASLLLYWRLRGVAGRPENAGQGLPWRQAVRIMGPFLLPLVGVVLVRSFMSAALTTYLPTFLTEEGTELWLAGIALSVLEFAGVGGALLGGLLSDRLGRKRILVISLVTTPLLMLLFLAFVAYLNLDGLVLFPLLLLLGFTSLSVTPVLMALVQESFPDNRALANGIYMLIGFLSRSGAVIILGAISDLWGMRLSFGASAIILLLGLPFVFKLPMPAHQP